MNYPEYEKFLELIDIYNKGLDACTKLLETKEYHCMLEYGDKPSILHNNQYLQVKREKEQS